MQKGPIVAVALGALAVVGIGAVFVNNASPYVTIQEASAGRQQVHVSGELVPDSLRNDVRNRKTYFQLKDETGTMNVVYTGSPQSNLAEATKIVVIGTMKNGSFESDRMLVKCPSKYESENAQKAKA